MLTETTPAWKTLSNQTLYVLPDTWVTAPAHACPPGFGVRFTTLLLNPVTAWLNVMSMAFVVFVSIAPAFVVSLSTPANFVKGGGGLVRRPRPVACYFL